MRQFLLSCGLLTVLSLSPTHATAARHQVGLIRRDGVVVRLHKTDRSQALAILVQQTQVEVLGRGERWWHVKIWDSVRGWVHAGDVVFRPPWTTTSTYRAPVIHAHSLAHPAMPLRVAAAVTVRTGLSATPGGAAAGWLAPGTSVTVTAWQQDLSGQIWYRVGNGWAPGLAIRFAVQNPALARRSGRPLTAIVSGKGMWLTLGTAGDDSAAALVQAAVRNGLTHLYVESAISPLGFHGRNAVGHLLAQAHRHHIAVIAWVYPYLNDIARDVALTRTVAAYRSPWGDRFDGIAADLERNISLSTVRAYSQLVRAYLGPNYLLVGVTYPPQSFPGYPFAEVGRLYNVTAPMDYWHQTETDAGLDYDHMRYGYSYAYRYAQDSVRAIQNAAGPVSVAPIGQTFDNFGRMEMGPHAPSADEIRGFLDGSRRSGAVGVSFFQWMTAAVNEWKVIHGYRFP